MTKRAMVIGLMTVGLSPQVLASYPAGVWTIPDHVFLEPTAKDPVTIRITGVFSLWLGQDKGYGEAAWGYMYFTCPAGNEEVCQMEWSELKAAEGGKLDLGDCLGFGSQDLPTGKVRPLGEAPANPDVYPIGVGVVPGFSPCQMLKDAGPPPPLPDVGPSEDAGTAPDAGPATDLATTDHGHPVNPDAGAHKPPDAGHAVDPGTHGADASLPPNDVPAEERDVAGEGGEPARPGPDTTAPGDGGTAVGGGGSGDGGCSGAKGRSGSGTAGLLLALLLLLLAGGRRRARPA